MAKKASEKIIKAAAKKAPAKKADTGSKKETPITRIPAEVAESAPILHGKEPSKGLFGNIGDFFSRMTGPKLTPEQQKQKELEDLRSAQGEYEASQKPGVLSKAMTGAKDFVKENPGVLADASRLGAGALSYYVGNKEREKANEILNEQKSRVENTQAQEMGPSAVSSMHDNAPAMEARAKALGLISERANMGLTPADMAELNQLRRSNQQQLQAKNAGVLEDRARRGVGGGGDELAAMLMNNQNASNMQSQEADRQAAMAFQNKMAAAQQLGSMGEVQQAADFNRQMQQGQQLDSIAQFNANQRQGMQNTKLNAMGGIANTAVDRQDTKAGNLANVVNTVGSTIGNRIEANDQEKRQKQMLQPQMPVK